MNEDYSRLWPGIEPILDAVLDLPEPLRSTRAAMLCGGHVDLARVVTRLLEADQHSDAFLPVLPIGWVGDPSSTTEDLAPVGDLERVGPFMIVRELGSGGMGQVLLGERDDGQFEQQVAIKVLHGDIAAGAAAQTLVRERRILARLDHPNIARIYDGGITAAGAPYFVMEHVDGLPLDDYCATRKPSVAERLQLFRGICRAIEYAHGRFVVHCDIKPRNILVTPNGVVKLLDFGIAQLLEGENQGLPRVPSRLLTPAYAAPEQLRGEAVTAATDVYQLGLVLHELLTGKRRREESSEATATPVSLPRDLKAILSRSLRDDPAERYATAEAFRRDIEDFLALRPVAARIDSAGYRFGKYLSRNRMLVMASTLVLVSLVGGLVGVTLQARRAARERDRASQAEKRATAVNDFVLHDLLRAPMPEVAMGREMTVAEVLANASRSAGHAFRGQPAMEADIRLALSQTYAALGRPADATAHAEAAFALLGPRPRLAPQLLRRAERSLAELKIDDGRIEDAVAELEALYRRDFATLGGADPETLETAAILGRAEIAVGDYVRAENLLRETLSITLASHPDAWRLALEVERELTRVLILRTRSVEAEQIARTMLATVQERLGPEHPERVTALTLLARTLSDQLRYSDATKINEEAVTLSRKLFGNEHPATADALHAKALADERLSHYDSAIEAVTEAHAIRARALGAESPQTLNALFDLAVLTLRTGGPAAAEPIYRQVAELRERSLGEAHIDTLRALRSLNNVLLHLGRDSDARQVAERMSRLYELATAAAGVEPAIVERYARHLLEVEPEDLQDHPRALALAERAVTATDRRSYVYLRTLADAQALNGHPELALATLRELLNLPDGIRSWSAEEMVVELLGAQASPAEVEAFLDGRVRQQRGRAGADRRMIGKSLRLLARHLEGQHRYPEAERHFEAALKLFREVLPAQNWEIGRVQSEFGGCLMAVGLYPEAEPHLLDGLQILQLDRQTRFESDAARKRLVLLYESWGQPEQAERWRAEADR